MKVLFDHPNPFFLAHGGFQIQIEQTRNALLDWGVEVEWVRWWDETQKGDLIHYFGRPGSVYIDLAQRKGMKVVMSDLLGGLGARSGGLRLLQKVLMMAAKSALPSAFTNRLAWEAYRKADAIIALTSWEAHLMQTMFDANPDRIFIVPNGVESVFFGDAPQQRGPWLVCTATINAGKRGVEVARAAIEAKTPIWFIGKPYSQEDPYFGQFKELADKHKDFIRYEGAINDRPKLAAIYRQARGFVLLSTWESLSISALEAAACGCPLLLSDLPWAHSTFGAHARYCSPKNTSSQTARILREFYDAAPKTVPPPKPKSWGDIGKDLLQIYRSAASNSL